MKTENQTSLLWPVLLAGLGVATLSAAIILVPSMARKFAEERAGASAPCPPSAPCPEAAPCPPAAPAPEALVAPAPAPAPASASGPWTIPLDPGNYDVLGDGQAAIDAIVGVLARDQKAKVVLTGMNNPNKSSKRAKRAAEVIKEKIVADVGVAPGQAEALGAQDPTIDGLVVRAEIAGGGR